MQQYQELIKALFGPDALQVLLVNVLNGNKNTTNINRLDNGIAMKSTVHGTWAAMGFFSRGYVGHVRPIHKGGNKASL